MSRRSSSSQWSRPATGRQIAALKSSGRYDGKYYSMGRASSAIGGSGGARSVAPQTGRRGLGATRGSMPFSGASSRDASALLANLLGVADDLDALVSVAVAHEPPAARPVAGDADFVESVSFTASPDESNADQPRILFEATVVRGRNAEREPSLEVRFVSNVSFGDVERSRPAQFKSGVEFDNE